jgi:hypothetical protein
MSMRHSKIIGGISEIHGIAARVPDFLMIVLSVRIPPSVSIKVRGVSAAGSRRQRGLLLRLLFTLLIITDHHGILVVLQVTAPGSIVLGSPGSIKAKYHTIQSPAHLIMSGHSPTLIRFP